MTKQEKIKAILAILFRQRMCDGCNEPDCPKCDVAKTRALNILKQTDGENGTVAGREHD